MKRNIVKRAGALGLLLALFLITLSATAVWAVPQIPHNLWGNVVVGVNGVDPIPVGVGVTAKINGTVYGSTTVNSSGQYSVNVAADDPDTPAIEGGVNGQTVQIYVGTTLAGTTVFQNGKIEQKNLAVPADPVINWANPAGIVYGTALSGTQLNAAAHVQSSATVIAGSFVYTPAAGAVLNAGAAQTLSTTFTPTDTVHYNTVTATATINVAKATPVITWANPADIVYGTALSGTQLNATATGISGSLAGTFVYAPAAGTMLNAGTAQTLNVTFTPTDTANYNGTTAAAAINVGAKPITVTPNAGQTKVYGAPDPTFTYTNTALVGGDAFSGALGRASGANVGSYAYALNTLSAGGNYILGLGGANTFAITAKPVTVTANAQTKVYGATDPTLTYTVSPALVSGDSFTGSLTRAAGENVGTFAIAQGTLALNSNYTLSYTGDNLTITALAVTVTANAQTKVYGATEPTLTYTFTPALVSGDSFTGALSRGVGANVGTYAIAQGSLALSANYTLSFTGANLTVTAKPITVTVVSGQSKVAGGSDPVFTYTSSDGTASFTGTLSRVSGEGAGAYAVSQGSLSAGANYTITIVTSDFTITPSGGGGGGGGGGFGNQLIGINLSGNSPFMDGNGKSVTAGTISNPDGNVTLSIPVGVFIWNSAGAAQTFLSYNSVAAPPAAPAQQKLIKSFEIGPSGATFNPAVSVVFNYTSADLAGGITESSLYIAWWNGTAWVKLASTVDTATKTVTAAITHSAIFGLFGQTTPATTVPPTTTPPPTTTTPPPPATTTAPPVTTVPSTTPPADGTKPNWLIPFLFIGAALLLGVILFARSRRPDKDIKYTNR